MSTIEPEKEILIFPGLKQPTNTEDGLLLRQFLLSLTEEIAQGLEDIALRRTHILAHRFLFGNELVRVEAILLPALQSRGLPITKEETDQEITPQILEKISDEDLQKLHEQVHGILEENTEYLGVKEISPNIEKMQQMEEDHRLLADMFGAMTRFAKRLSSLGDI